MTMTTTDNDDNAAVIEMIAKYRAGELTDEQAAIVRELLDKVATLAAGWRRIDEFRRALSVDRGV
jgi:hypothetical protein